jgi:hypothetical protein
MKQGTVANTPITNDCAAIPIAFCHIHTNYTIGATLRNGWQRVYRH